MILASSVHLLGVYTLSVLYFTEFALLFRSLAITLASGRVRSFLRHSSPILVVVYCSPGSFFVDFLLFVGFPCLFPAALLTVLLLHSALPTFSFVFLVLSSAQLRFSLLRFHFFLCSWATPAAVPRFRFPLLVIP